VRAWGGRAPRAFRSARERRSWPAPPGQLVHQPVDADRVRLRESLEALVLVVGQRNRQGGHSRSSEQCLRDITEHRAPQRRLRQAALACQRDSASRPAYRS
jgi:hypothetical protein